MSGLKLRTEEVFHVWQLRVVAVRWGHNIKDFPPFSRFRYVMPARQRSDNWDQNWR